MAQILYKWFEPVRTGSGVNLHNDEPNWTRTGGSERFGSKRFGSPVRGSVRWFRTKPCQHYCSQVVWIGAPCHGLVLLQWYARHVFHSHFVFLNMSIIGFCTDSGSCASSFVGVFLISHSYWGKRVIWVGSRSLGEFWRHGEVFRHLPSFFKEVSHEDQMWRILKEEWAKLGADYCESLYRSCARRVNALWCARGGHTKY